MFNENEKNEVAAEQTDTLELTEPTEGNVEESVEENTLVPNVEPQGEQPLVETGEQQDVIDVWENDPRYGKMWKSPQDTYKSYKNAEARLQELKPYEEKYNSLATKFQEKGLSLEQLDDYITEYQELTDINSPMVQNNKILDYFNLSHIL